MSSTSSTASSASASASASNLSGVLAVGAAAAGAAAGTLESFGFDLPSPPCRSSIEDLRVAQLRAELETRGLDAGGRKAELVGRLLQARQEEWNVSLCRVIRREMAAFRRREMTAVAGSDDGSLDDDSQDDDSQEHEQLDEEQEEGDDLSTESDRSHQQRLRELEHLCGVGRGQPFGGNNSNDQAILEAAWEQNAANCEAAAQQELRVIAEAVERQMLPLRQEMANLQQQHARDVANLRAENEVLADDVFRLRAQLRRLQGKEAGAGSGEEEKKGEQEDE